jgi:hypothetical protein
MSRLAVIAAALFAPLAGMRAADPAPPPPPAQKLSPDEQKTAIILGKSLPLLPEKEKEYEAAKELALKKAQNDAERAAGMISDDGLDPAIESAEEKAKKYEAEEMIRLPLGRKLEIVYEEEKAADKVAPDCFDPVAARIVGGAEPGKEMKEEEVNAILTKLAIDNSKAEAEKLKKSPVPEKRKGLIERLVYNTLQANPLETPDDSALDAVGATAEQKKAVHELLAKFGDPVKPVAEQLAKSAAATPATTPQPQ